jgi:hypothetical protein
MTFRPTRAPDAGVCTSGRQLFIYWRCAGAERDAALAATRALQARLREQLPGLQAQLFVRTDTEAAGTATLMETYARPEGLDATAQRRIEHEAGAALQAWCQGGRHVESFEPVAD